MIRRLLVTTSLLGALAAPAWAAPADFGPPDGWAQERSSLEGQRRNPVVGGLLNGLIPGMGSAYHGDVIKGVIQAGGWLGIWIGSQLLSSGIMALSGNRDVAVVVAIAPIAAYHGYAAADGWMSANLTNERIDHKLEAISPISFKLQVARF
jgi:hypothetical protein